MIEGHYFTAAGTGVARDAACKMYPSITPCSTAKAKGKTFPKTSE